MTPYAPRRITVTGATGSIGSALVARLLRTVPGLHVTALARSAAAPRLVPLLAAFPGQLSVVEQDLCDLRLTPSQRRQLAETDGLWHLAASTALRGDDAAAWRVNDGGTAAVLDLLASVDAPGPLLHVSTAYVCGTRTGRVTEADLSTGDFRNAYEASKAAAEHRVRTAFAAGLRGCVLRPSVVVEDDVADGSPKMIDVVAAAVSAANRAGEPLVLRLPPTAALNVVHSDWVLDAMVALAAGPMAGATVHLTARRPLRLAELPVVLDPAASPRSLSPLARRLERAIAPFRPYLSGGVDFDRTNFEAAAPHLADVRECDPIAVLRHRRDAAKAMASEGRGITSVVN